MGAPDSGMQAAEQATADSLLTSLRTIKADERLRHVGVLDYWLSIRGNKEFPPLHDLDPLEISDAGPGSILLELIGGGQDAEVRHLGDALKGEVVVDRIIDAPNPSILACIAKKLPIVAISRDFLAFEDSYDTADGWTRCWITLLPLSSCGSWVDYVYAFVSVEKSGGKTAKPAEAPAPLAEAIEAAAEAASEDSVADAIDAEAAEATGDESAAEEAAEPVVAAEEPAVDEVSEPVEPEAAVEEAEASEPAEAVEAEQPVAEESVEPVEAVDAAVDPEPVEAVVEPEPIEAADEPVPVDPVEAVAEVESEQVVEPEETVEIVEESEPAPRAKSPGFAKLFEGFANLTGFYGQSVNIDPAVPVEPEDEGFAEEPQAVEEPAPEPEAAESDSVEAAAEPEEPAVEAVAIEEPAEEPPTEPVSAIADTEAASESVSQPAPALEGALHSKLTEVRAKADEARQAALRATAALHEGLSAAYDFALDAETSPEEYLRLVEAQGLKIQLRAPMAPVARLAFDGLVDPATLGQCEKILAWALKEELPRGALLDRIDQAGGLAELAGDLSKAA